MLQRSSHFFLAPLALLAVSEATMMPPECLSDRGHTFLNHSLNNQSSDWYWCVDGCGAPPDSCEAANAYIAPGGCAGHCEAEDVRQYFLARGYIGCDCELNPYALPEHEQAYLIVKHWDDNTQCSGDPSRITAIKPENYIQFARDSFQGGAICHQWGQGAYGGPFVVLGCLRTYLFTDEDCMMGPPISNTTVLSEDCTEQNEGTESEIVTCSLGLPDGVTDPDCADEAASMLPAMGLDDPRQQGFSWPACVADCAAPPQGCNDAVKILHTGCGSDCNATEMTVLLQASGAIGCDCALTGCVAESLAMLFAAGIDDPRGEDFDWPTCIDDCPSQPQDCETAQSMLGAGGCASDCNATEVTLLLRVGGAIGCDCVIPELTTTTTVTETTSTTTVTPTTVTTPATTTNTTTVDATTTNDTDDSVGGAVLHVGAPKLALAMATMSLLFFPSARS